MSITVVFLDGVGIGPADRDRNPFLTADLPVLRSLAGHVPTLEHPRLESTHGPHQVAIFPVDATLETEGLPQSGTGQAALLTGRNAAHIFGRHFGSWTPVKLRPIVEADSVLALARADGHRTAFLNAYPEGWPWGRTRLAAIPLAARAVGLMDRHVEALRDGRAIASGIVNEGWIEHLGHSDLPRIGPREAGETLSRLSRDYDLGFFAHYTTDHVGHRGGMSEARAALERVDAFLGGLLDGLPDGSTVLVVSDHGNIEWLGTGHTRNPALGMLVGPDAHRRSASLASITDATPALLDWLARDPS